jgi:hypothetical protein
MRTKRSAKIWACSGNGFSIRITNDESCTVSAGKTLSDKPSVWQEGERRLVHKDKAVHTKAIIISPPRSCVEY